MITLTPDWPVSTRVHALVTTRAGGFSLPPYHALNLAAHVGDDADAVARNRALLKETLALPTDPIWLTQVHGCDIYDADTAETQPSVPPVADASITQKADCVLSVLTADCLPILITNRAESLVMAVHAGWRGLADGIVAAAVERSGELPENLLVWIGPGIGGQAFEVGDDVLQAFLSQGAALETHFTSLGLDDQGARKYLADTAQIAFWQLKGLGVGWMGGGQWCTYQEEDRFFSFRRHEKTGRMASLIWLSHTP